MPQYTPQQIYAAARTLLPMLPDTMRRQAEALLAQAEGGQDTHLHLLNLLTQDEAIRKPLRALLKGETDAERLMGYAGLGGEQDSTKPGDLYVCPLAGCDTRYAIIEAGETPPPCSKHRKALIPAAQKKGR